MEFWLNLNTRIASVKNPGCCMLYAVCCFERPILDRPLGFLTNRGHTSKVKKWSKNMIVTVTQNLGKRVWFKENPKWTNNRY